jgi:prefoldin subunit 5
MSFSFSYEARKRIAGKGAAEISAFLEETPLAVRRKVFANLPAIDGFRKNTDIEFRKKSERLVAALTHVPDLKLRAASKEWNAFEAIWRAWGQKKFGKTLAPTAIDYEAAGEEEALTFLRDLVARQVDGCAREDVDRLVQFGGFAITSGVTAFLAALPTREALERDRTISRLPTDVKALQQGMDDMKRAIRDLDGQLREVSSHAANTATVAKVSSEVSGEVSRKLTEMERRPLAVTSADFEKLKGQISARAEQLEKKLEQNLRATTTSEESYGRAIDKLQMTVAKLAADIDDMRSSLAVAEQSYQRAVDESKIRLTLLSEQKIETVTHGEASNRKSLSGLVKWSIPKLTTQPNKLTDASAIFEFAKSSFLAIGLRQTDADKVARTVVAGVLSGQMVQFRGSLAEFMATASVCSLGGERTLSWQVPLGLYDSCDADALLELVEAKSEHYPGVLLRGVNRSAFEIYGSPIRDLVLESQFVGMGRLPLGAGLFATWVDGPATLPGDRALLELGPIVDTDELMWSQTSNWDMSRCAAISFQQDEIRNLIDHSKEQVSEAINIVNALDLPRNRLWRFAFARYLGALFALPGADYERDLTTALLSWVIPWARVNGLSRERVERAIGEFSTDQLETLSVKQALSELTGEAVL